MAHYTKGLEVVPYVEAMLERYHPQLRDAGVTFTCLMAYAPTDKNGDPTGPALTHGGYAALATVKIIGLKERADGRADVEITVDGDRWSEVPESRRYALIDHELEHLELKYDKDANVLRDDLDRPKLGVRKHDHQYGWFDAIVRRHGKDAMEYYQWVKFQNDDFANKWSQYLDSPDTTPVQNLIKAVKDKEAAPDKEAA
jgi:hypothetical protein